MPILSSIGGGSNRGFRNLSIISPSLFAFTTHTFTNATASGTYGPTLANCQSSYAGQSWLSSYFSVPTRGFQQWTVPKSGTYRIKVAGAQGGAGKWNSYYGGFGAIMQGDISLSSGDTLIMIIGQKGGYNSNSSQGSAGGGGGSFVSRNTISNLLIAAGGGGGGGGNSSPANGIYAVTYNTGASASSNSGGSGGAGGTGTSGASGGGGGFTSAGTGGGGSGGAAPGQYINGGTAEGGRGGSCTASQSGSYNFNLLGNDQGGFGGGGGGEWCSQGACGGGGGYSGGGGNVGSSGPGAGGGSYFASSITNRYTSDGAYNGSSSGIISLGAWNGVTTLSEQAASHGYIIVTFIS